MSEAVDLFTQVRVIPALSSGVFPASLWLASLPSESREHCLTCSVIQSIEGTEKVDDGDKSDSDEDDIEAMIKKEVEGLKPSQAKSRPFQAIRMDLPCRAFDLHMKSSISPITDSASIVHSI